MPKFVSASVYQAHRWFKNGDHPDDDVRSTKASDGTVTCSEGKVVRYFRDPRTSGDSVCRKCSHTMHEHGFLDQVEMGAVVCPGDWIVDLWQGLRAPVNPRDFERQYRRVGIFGLTLLSRRQPQPATRTQAE